MSDFTPGPWEIRRDIPYSTGLVVFHDRFEKNVTVCRIWHSRPEMQQANASLIASAPNLYAALRAIFDELNDRYDGAPDSRVLWMGEHITRIQRALAKASGK